MRRAIELPDHVDAAKVAAAMNPAMSAWLALRRRVPIEAAVARVEQDGRTDVVVSGGLEPSTSRM